MLILLAQGLLNGLLLGGIYSAYSVGFSLIFGVLGIMNVAHGELVMLGAFLSYWMLKLLGVDPFLSLPVAFLALFLFGFFLQRLVLSRVVEAPPLMSLLSTFGLSLIIANSALLLWTADFRMVTTSYSGFNVSLGGIVIPLARLITFFAALLLVGGLYLFLNRTELGRAIRATAQDREAARLMGVNVRRIHALTFALGAGVTGLAGSLVTAFFPIYPYMGQSYTLFAFCVVVLGGMGYVPGALWGGMTLGVVQSLTGTFLSSGLSLIITFLLLFFMLLLRPRGIAGRGIME